MKKKRRISIVAVVLLILLALIVISASEVAVEIIKPLNQSYNASSVPTTVNVTTSSSAGCKFMLNAKEQGENWTQLNSSAGFTARDGASVVTTSNGRMWLMGGYDNFNFYNDVWYSDDGANWTMINESVAWEDRYLASAIVKSDGSMWIMGGWNSSNAYKNDVWNSTDGSNWTLVNASVEWEPRYGLTALVTSNDAMWIIGGQNTSSGSDSFTGDVWNSSNGADWILINATAIPNRRQHTAVVGASDRLWVMAGYNTSGARPNDVWYSDGGLNWMMANGSAFWGGRDSPSAAYTPDDGRIWIMGGYHNIMGYMNDVSYSTDGANWSFATTSAGWSGRQMHSTVVALNGSLVLVSGFSGSMTNDVWYSRPYTSMVGGSTEWGKEFVPNEGSNIVYAQCRNPLNGAVFWNSTNVSFYIDSIVPVLTVSSPLNASYNNSASIDANVTISESTMSTCLYSLNGAVNETMDGSGTEWGIGFTAAEGSNTIVVSCNDTVDNWNSTSVTFFLDSVKPVLNITRPFNITYSYTNLTVNVTTNESASICQYAHNVTFEQNWTLLNVSSFSARQGHTIVNLNGVLWMIGGVRSEIIDFILTNVYLNDTWYSTDGISWTQGNASTAFAGRAYHSSVVTPDNKIWVIAGYDGTNYLNDTWFSTDGDNWERANASAFPGRYSHTSVVDSSGNIWVIAGLLSDVNTDPPILSSGETNYSKEVTLLKGGGGTPAPTNTTWYSTDGYAWYQGNASAFPARYAHSSAIDSNGRMWVMGGITVIGVTNTPLNDVWYSDDGINWNQATSSAEWAARGMHLSFSTADNRIWTIGGTDGTNYYNDVWYSGNGTSWVNVNSTTNSSFWTARDYFAGAVKGDNIYIAGGLDSNSNKVNDSWTTPIPPWYRDMDGSGTEWGNNFTAAHGNNNVKVKCWDTAGNLNSSMQWFTVDVQGPEITISSPLNQSYTTSSTTLTISLDETATTCVYSLNSAANVTMTGSGTSWSASSTAVNGGNTITVSCQDTLGNWNSNSIAFTATFSTGTACGNNVCEEGETNSNCAVDCPSTGGTSGSLSGGVSSSKAAEGYNFELKANIPVEKTIAKEGVAVKKVTLNSKENAEKVNLQVSKYETLPQNIKAPEGKMYQVLELKLDREIELKEAEICFNVEKQWMEEENIQKEEVVLVRYHPRQVLNIERAVKSEKEFKVSIRAGIEEWQELETNLIEKPEITEFEKTEENYCAKTPGFSTFAIVARKQQMIEVIREAAPIIKEIQKSAPEKDEFIIPFSPPYKKLYTIIFIDLFLIFVLIAAFSTGENLYEEKKEIWYQCNEMVRKAPDSKKVKEFIKASLKGGYSEEDIKQAIAGHGIDETCTELFIENVKEELMAENSKGK